MNKFTSLFDGIDPPKKEVDQSMSRQNMFSSPEPAKVSKNLFGESVQVDAKVLDIENWVKVSGLSVSSNKINFALTGIDVLKITSMQISEIGKFHIEEATEAARCVDVVVGDFAALKPVLEAPKTGVLEAIRTIEVATSRNGLLGLFKAAKRTDWAEVRRQVKLQTSAAAESARNCVKYHLDPFISGLSEAKRTLKSVMEGLDTTFNALQYVIDRNPDAIVQDLCRRRQEMFQKSIALMQLNMSQIDKMNVTCEHNKTFSVELEMTIWPVIENVIRSAIIDDVNGEAALQDVATKLKGILV